MDYSGDQKFFGKGVARYGSVGAQSGRDCQDLLRLSLLSRFVRIHNSHVEHPHNIMGGDGKFECPFWENKPKSQRLPFYDLKINVPFS